MKNIILAIVASVIFIGCSGESHHSVLNLPNYQAMGKYPAKKAVYINGVNDKRKNKSTVATITDTKGTVSEYISLGGDLSAWFENALGAELKKSGAKITNDAPISVDIDINELHANLSGYASDNLKGVCAVTLHIYKANTVITKKLSGPQTKFALVPTAGAFEPFLKELLGDMVIRAAKAILSE